MHTWFRRTRATGFTLIELLIGVAILGILAAIAIPNVMSAQKKARYAQAASDTQKATTQAIVYATDHNQNPGTIAVLRSAGYVNATDTDPWGQAWVCSPAFADTASPANPGEMGVCSQGPARTGTCTFPMTGPGVALRNGSVGYSSVYGSWQGLP